MGKVMRAKTFDLAIRVLVADDTRLHTQLLADALRREGDLEVTCSDAQELTSLTNLHNIDVLLLGSDLREQPGCGFEVLREVHAAHPNLRAVTLLDSSNSESILGAFRAGARGVLSREDSIETLSKCVRRVHQGQIWANSHQMALVVEALAASRNQTAVIAQGIEQLSKREMEVVGCVAQGLTNRDIANRLDLSEHTIKNYLFRIYEKLGASNRVELLFMTLSQACPPELAGSSDGKSGVDQGMQSASVLAANQRAAEHGVLSAQLELARYYWTRKSNPKDAVLAYKWYLIASHQVSRASQNAGKALTMEQLLQAEQMAAEWLKKTARFPPTSIGSSSIPTANAQLCASFE
jgi:DNA-binding NarL/FixJ family response regulator